MELTANNTNACHLLRRRQDMTCTHVDYDYDCLLNLSFLYSLLQKFKKMKVGNVFKTRFGKNQTEKLSQAQPVSLLVT